MILTKLGGQVKVPDLVEAISEMTNHFKFTLPLKYCNLSLSYVMGCKIVDDDIIVPYCQSSLAMFLAPFYMLGAYRCVLTKNNTAHITLYDPIKYKIIFGKKNLFKTKRTHANDLYGWVIKKFIASFSGKNVLFENVEDSIQDPDKRSTYDEQNLTVYDAFKLTAEPSYLYLTSEDFLHTDVKLNNVDIMQHEIKLCLESIKNVDELLPEFADPLTQSQYDEAIKSFEDSLEKNENGEVVFKADHINYKIASKIYKSHGLVNEGPLWYIIICKRTPRLAAIFFLPTISVEVFQKYINEQV